MPLVIQGLCRSLAFILIFLVEKKYHIMLKTILKKICAGITWILQSFNFLPINFKDVLSKTDNRLFIKSFVNVNIFILQ